MRELELLNARSQRRLGAPGRARSLLPLLLPFPAPAKARRRRAQARHHAGDRRVRAPRSWRGDEEHGARSESVQPTSRGVQRRKMLLRPPNRRYIVSSCTLVAGVHMVPGFAEALCRSGAFQRCN
eukprot:15467454-Alexandrium_andersonii.AAC.1